MIRLNLVTNNVPVSHATINKNNDSLQNKQGLQNDIFIRSTNNVSFGSKHENKAENLKDGLKDIGMVGAPLLLGVTAGVLSVSSVIDTEELFDDDVKVDAVDKSLEFGIIKADADDGIFKVAGTGINIDPSRFDYSDPENGIYSNYDGSVDIDLMNGKYIDSENGIYVDESKGISAVVDQYGNARHFVLPAFGGYQTYPYPTMPIRDFQSEPNIVEDGVVKTVEHHIHEIFENIFGAENMEDVHDMFGRTIVQAEDDTGKYLSFAPTNMHIDGAPSMSRYIEGLNDETFNEYISGEFDESDGFIDLDGDGQPDAVDLDGDGLPDGTLIDTDGDNIPDGIDLDGDGNPDILF